MRIRRKDWARPELEKCGYFIAEPKLIKGSWRDEFNNNNPIHLDLGCGKCVFLAAIAKENPEINYIGIDISVDILGVGKRIIDDTFDEVRQDNIRLFAHNIQRLQEVFTQNEGIERVYINFCNPWPKARAHKKRLTYTNQLEIYKKLLSPGAEIWFKTDDDDLYISSLRYFKEAGLNIYYSTKDLHGDRDIENFFTEHENMFTEKGIKTKAIRARL